MANINISSLEVMIIYFVNNTIGPVHTVCVCPLLLILSGPTCTLIKGHITIIITIYPLIVLCVANGPFANKTIIPYHDPIDHTFAQEKDE